jgi:hypothetical protein
VLGPERLEDEPFAFEPHRNFEVVEDERHRGEPV